MENSNIFTMRVRHSNPEWAYEVLRAMIECYPQVADYVVGGTDLIMLDESGVPNQPVYDLDLTDHLMIGAAGGLVIWFAFTLLLTLGRRTIHNEDELQRTLNFTCLGIVPATKVVGKDKRCPLIHHDSGKFGFAESVRLLQMHVSKEMHAQNKKILMVSGATPGEGKTTIAVNLAIASAKAGKRTLLVDCDQYNPSVSRSLSVEKNVTMREYMQGTVGAKELLSKTSIRHLYCMNTGVDVKDKGVKDSFEMLLRAARETFDIIILDTPPCSLMVDAAELSDLADCALMVIRQDYASRDQIIEGVRLLTDNGLPMLGCALNGVNGNLATYGYQYGNGYGYGYGYGYSYGYGYGRKYGYGYGSKKSDGD
jgi:capsular exopolysaccharide synthesis family protein